ncbi:MAG: hypothetical protein KC506_03910 [Nanoarchaeota archaeon]|nr:hypothetical protein [Nanoarchaeota archaeon]
MADVKVDTRGLKAKFEFLQKKIAGAVGNELRKEVLSSIKRGVSPVKGQGRFQKYSESYTGIIKRGIKNKRVSPVNLTLSGELLDSIYVKLNNNKITIGFSDEKFEYHNKPESGSNMPARRLLPTEPGEEFSKSITLRIRNLVLERVKQIFK